MNRSNVPEQSSVAPSKRVDASPTDASARKGKRRRPLPNPYERPAVPALLDAREAAEALRCSVEALRARCRRAAKVDANGNVIAPLAPGVTAIKFGRNTWRVRFDAK